MNALGLVFVVVYGFLYLTQFVSMLVHRFITAVHHLSEETRVRKEEPVEAQTFFSAPKVSRQTATLCIQYKPRPSLYGE